MLAVTSCTYRVLPVLHARASLGTVQVTREYVSRELYRRIETLENQVALLLKRLDVMEATLRKDE